MSENILAKQIEIRIVYVPITKTFFYTRRVNGVIDPSRDRIPAWRAEQIYQANRHEANQISDGKPAFDCGNRDWSWTVKLMERGE